MTANIVNEVAFLRTTRNFPEDISQLTLEINKAYVDTANVVNSRTIGLYPTNRPAINGENWFLQGNKRQQGFRQVYNLTSAVVNNYTINLGFKLSSISQISLRSYGAFTDGTNWYGLIFGSNVAIAGQISFYVSLNAGSTTSDQITFKVGAGAPAITSGIVDIEWISNP